MLVTNDNLKHSEVNLFKTHRFCIVSLGSKHRLFVVVVVVVGGSRWYVSGYDDVKLQVHLACTYVWRPVVSLGCHFLGCCHSCFLLG